MKFLIRIKERVTRDGFVMSFNKASDYDKDIIV